MARVAFVMDKLLRKIGLSGRSIVPMLIGFGCTVPGVMASRTLPSERDRKMTILLTPVYELFRKAAYLRLFYRSILPGAWHPCDDSPVFWRYYHGYFNGTYFTWNFI